MRWTRRSAVAGTTAAVLIGGGFALAQGAASQDVPGPASDEPSVEELLSQLDALEAAVTADTSGERGAGIRGVDDSGDAWDDSDGRGGDDMDDDDHEDDDHDDD